MCTLTCIVGCFAVLKCSQYFWRVVIALSGYRHYAGWYDEDTGCDARSQNRESARRQVRSTSRVRQPPAAPDLPRWQQGQARDPGQPVPVARCRDRSSPGRAGGQDAGGRRAGAGGDRFPTAWARRGDPRPGQSARAASLIAVSYTHLRAHETVLDLVCRLLLE